MPGRQTASRLWTEPRLPRPGQARSTELDDITPQVAKIGAFAPIYRRQQVAGLHRGGWDLARALITLVTCSEGLRLLH